MKISGEIKNFGSSSVGGNITSSKGQLVGSISTGSSGNVKIVHTGTTEYWDSQSSLVGKESNVYVYSDYQEDSGSDVPGIKIGDGSTLLSELPFVSGNAEIINNYIETYVNSNLSEVAKTGDVDDLVQSSGTYFILDCGTSTLVV